MQNLRRLFTFLAFGPYNSKLVEAVTHVDDEKRVDNSLVQIWRLKFGHKANFLFGLWAQGLVKILKLKLGHKDLFNL